MSHFSVIAEVSEYIVGVLRQNLCPDVIASPDKIIQTSPNDTENDYLLGMYLYDIEDSGETPRVQMLPLGKNSKQVPPKPLSLRFMLFVNPNRVSGTKAAEEQIIIGKAVQTLHDNSRIPRKAIAANDGAVAEDIFIYIVSSTFEDKAKIWSCLQMPIQPSIHIKVLPVLISSMRTEDDGIDIYKGDIRR